MDVASDRWFRFPVGPDAFWDAISATHRYRQWWPWLHSFEARRLDAGERWRCAVRPPLRYTVRFTVDLGAVDPPRLIEARIGGDITGTAELLVVPDGDACTVNLRSRLEPSQPALRIITSFAGPLVRRGHDWILEAGAHQFAGRALGAVTTA